MTLPRDFTPVNIADKLEETGMRGQNFIFLTDWKHEQLISLFEVAEMIEPFWKHRLNLMNNKILGTIFFQPSTRTRFSTEDAMVRLGGSVLSESNPLNSSSTAKGESLSDYLRTVSTYTDVIGLRHYDDESVFSSLDGAMVPVISCGWGNVTHPTQGILDLYTCYRAFGDFENMKIMIATPDLSRARSGHSFAMGLAKMGAEIIYIGSSENKIHPLVQSKLDEAEARYTIYNDLNNVEIMDLMSDCDACYLPGCSVPKDNPEDRAAFLDLIKPFYITLEGLEKIKNKKGKKIGIMHSLPRNEVEFDSQIDNSEFQLYFQQMAFSVPIRMALIAAIVGVK